MVVGFFGYPVMRSKKYPDLLHQGHGAITYAVLSQLPNDQLEYEIVDYVSAVIYRDGYKKSTEHLAKLSPGFRAVYATWVLEGEVNNGGFSQFFFNSSGELAYEARDGCWLIGARYHVQVVIDAIALEMRQGTPGSTFPDSATYEKDFGENYPYADYDLLDDRFYTVPEDLSRLRIRYIREHPDQFIGPAID